MGEIFPSKTQQNRHDYTCQSGAFRHELAVKAKNHREKCRSRVKKSTDVADIDNIAREQGNAEAEYGCDIDKCTHKSKLFFVGFIATTCRFPDVVYNKCCNGVENTCAS